MNLNELLCEKQGAENVNENAANGNVNNPNAIEIERAKTNIAEADEFTGRLNKMLDEIEHIIERYEEESDRRRCAATLAHAGLKLAIEGITRMKDYEIETIALCSECSQD